MEGFMLLLIISVVVAGTSSSQNATDCSPCTCEPDIGGTNVYCSGLGLTQLPTNLPNDTVNLNFKYNNLTRLDLVSLCKLRLLRGVDLSKNKISSIRGSFKCFTNLMLDLSNNSFESLEAQAFGLSFRWLREAFLFNNPWKCDCRLRWLKADMDKHRSKFPPMGVRCQTPSGLNGQLFQNIKAADFVCPDPFPFWAKLVIPIGGVGMLLVSLGTVGCFRWTRKSKLKPVFRRDGCIPTDSSLILEWTFAEGYSPTTCLVYVTGGAVKTLAVPREQCVDGTWTCEVSEDIVCNTEYNVRVCGGSERDRRPYSDSISLVTVSTGVHSISQRHDNVQYVRDFWIIGHEEDNIRIEKLCKTLERHYNLIGGMEYRDCEGGDSVFDGLETAISTSKIVLVVLSNSTKGNWVKYQIQTARHCLMGIGNEVEERQQTSHRLIPVRLMPCGKPPCLRTLTTLDMWNKYFWRNLLAAFEEKDCNEDSREADTDPLV